MKRTLLMGSLLLLFLFTGSIVFSQSFGCFSMSRGFGISNQSSHGYGFAGCSLINSSYYPDRDLSEKPLTEKEARKVAEGWLKALGNPNLKVGKVKDKKENYEVEIVTKDNSLVEKFVINKESGICRVKY